MKTPSAGTVLGTVALVVALSTTAYAANVLPTNSVGTPQLKRNAVTSVKVKDGSLLANDFKQGQLPAGAKGDPGPSTGPAGGALAGAYPNPTLAAGSVGARNLAPDALGSSITFTPLESCNAASFDGTVAQIVFTDRGYYSTSDYLECPLQGVPNGAHVTSVEVGYVDTNPVGAVRASLLGTDTTLNSATASLVREAASTGASPDLRTLTVTPTGTVVVGTRYVYFLQIFTPSSTTTVIHVTVRYLLDGSTA